MTHEEEIIIIYSGYGNLIFAMKDGSTVTVANADLTEEDRRDEGRARKLFADIIHRHG